MGLKQKTSGTFFNLKIKDQAFPVIEQVGREDGEWVVIAEGNYYEGFFVDAKIEEYEFKKETKQKLVMEFHDEEGAKETLSVNFNSLALNIINTLAGQEDIVGKKISFSVYSKKDNKGEDRPRIYIEVDDQKTEWKFGPDILSQIHEHHHKWVDMFNKYVKPMCDSPAPKEEEKTVFEEYNEEQDEKPKTKTPVKGKGKKEEPKAAAKKATKKAEPEPVEEDEDDMDDLPF